MSGWKKLASAAAASGAVTNVEDVFSTYLYDGNSGNQTITNGIDLSTEGGMVWIKDRTGTSYHALFDTERGANVRLIPSGNNAEYDLSDLSVNGLTAFNTDGFDLGSWTITNDAADDHVAWTFRKAPKFFDVVTYTGDGTAGRQISHNLGSVPGFIIVKKTSNAGDWIIQHRSLGAQGSGNIRLNSTDAAVANGQHYWGNGTVDEKQWVNASGETYVAYLFAHNDGDGDFGPTGDQDIIKCGSYTGTGTESISNFVDVGFEPQFLLVKRATGGSEDWIMGDTQRGFCSSLYTNTNGHFRPLQPNSATAEYNDSLFWLQNNGFSLVNNSSQVNASGSTYIYIAIRQGNMGIPENASDVFDIGTDTSLSSNELMDGTDTDLADMVISTGRNVSTSNVLSTRFTGGDVFTSGNNSEERFGASYTQQWGDIKLKNKAFSGNPSTVHYSWKRAHSFFDVVGYISNVSSGNAMTIDHKLGVVPEMIWVRKRSANLNWFVYHKDNGYGNNGYLNLNNTAAATNHTASPNVWNSTTPTASSFTVGSFLTDENQKYVAYLFATLDGVSKVGSFSHTNNTTTSVNCGFSSGARFVMIKLRDGADSWYIWDTTRGINAGTEPLLRLNTTSAEITTNDWIDPLSSGFQITGPDLLTGTYIFYAIA